MDERQEHRWLAKAATPMYYSAEVTCQADVTVTTQGSQARRFLSTLSLLVVLFCLFVVTDVPRSFELLLRPFTKVAFGLRSPGQWTPSSAGPLWSTKESTTPTVPPAPLSLDGLIRPLRTFELEQPPELPPPSKINTQVVTIGAMVSNATAEGPGKVYFGVWFGEKDHRNSITLLEERTQTENRALLRAALAALRAVPPETTVEIRTPSDYIPKAIYGALNRWRRSAWTAPDIKNKQLWQQLDDAMSKRPGKVIWKRASKAEQDILKQSFIDHLESSVTTASITLGVMLPALRPYSMLYGCWFGLNDSRNVVMPLKGELQTENRAILSAAIMALNQTRSMGLSAVELRTRSNYLLQAIRLLPKWSAKDWRASDGQMVSNADLWDELWKAIQSMPETQISWRYLWKSADLTVQAELFPPSLVSNLQAPVSPALKTSTVVIYTSVVWPQGKGSPAIYGLWFGSEDPRNQARVASNVVQSQNKAELEAVIAALSQMVLEGQRDVEIRTHSIYIVQNIQKLDEWRDNQWRKKRGEPISHLEEWKQVDNFIRSNLLNVRMRYVELPDQKEAISDLTRRAMPLLPATAADFPLPASLKMSSMTSQMDPLPLAPLGTTVAYTGIVWPWGWGAVPVYSIWFGEGDARNVVETEKEEVTPYQSQNRAELRAALKAIEVIQSSSPLVKRLEIRTHCQYLVSAYQQLKTWKARQWILQDGSEVPNRDLWEALDLLISRSGMRLAFRFVPRDIYTAAQADLASRAPLLQQPQLASLQPQLLEPAPSATQVPQGNPVPEPTTAGVGVAALVAAAVREPSLTSQLNEARPPPIVTSAVRAALPSILTEAGVPQDTQAEVAEELMAPGQAVEAMWAAAKAAATLHNPVPGEVEKTILSVLNGAVKFAYEKVRRNQEGN